MSKNIQTPYLIFNPSKTPYWVYRWNLISFSKVSWRRKIRVESELINNYYINSRTQIQTESSINPFPPNHNSFLDNSFSFLYFYYNPVGIKVRREGIHTRFCSSLDPGINIIIIYSFDSTHIFLLFFFNLPSNSLLYFVCKFICKLYICYKIWIVLIALWKGHDYWPSFNRLLMR